jgi:hypothetical protein
MKIDSYSFGKMVIDDQVYKSDLIIYPDKIDSSWWRKEGHLLQLEDLEAILAAAPEILVVGTGYFGLMKVQDELKKELAGRNMELHVEKSARAVEIFNSFRTRRKTVGAFHLTC